MRADFVNPFVQAADEVLEAELGEPPTRGNLNLRPSAYTTDDVTALVRVGGAISGFVLYSMSQQTTCKIVTKLLGEPCNTLTDLATSAIGELGNVITGRAATLLAEAGFPANLAPPQIIIGRGTLISVVDTRRLVIPLGCLAGPLEIQVVLAESPRSLAA